MIRLLLVDDEPAVRRGLRMRLALEPDIEVVGEADDGAAALEQVERHKPTVVVMDIMMPGLDGIEATTRLQECCPETAVVILTLHDRPETRELARVAGACCLVGKQEEPSALVNAIRAAAARLSV
ncbi:MAG: response regulator transcription factor [Dehalococcoidia bacterium]